MISGLGLYRAPRQSYKPRTPQNLADSSAALLLGNLAQVTILGKPYDLLYIHIYTLW